MPFEPMPTVRTRKHLNNLAITALAIPPSPQRDKVGYFNHDRFRGYISVHLRFGLRSPCLRFAVHVTVPHARLGTRLLARLCHGNHLRLLYTMRFPRRNSHRTVREPLDSSGSYRPTADRERRQCANRWLCSFIMRWSHCSARRWCRRSRLYFCCIHRTRRRSRQRNTPCKAER